MVDSIPSVVKTPPWEMSRIDQAPMSHAESMRYTTGHDSYINGVKPQTLNKSIATDSGVLTIITLMLLLVAFNFKHCYRLFRILGQDLLSVRRRNNAFDDSTASETRVLIVLLIQLWVCEGLLTYAWLTHQGYITVSDPLLPVAAMVGLACAFYLFSLVAYHIVGYTFTDPAGASQWTKGFNASQAFLSIALLVPALVGVFYPMLLVPMLWIAVGLYVAARIIFIIKGFRIFYDNFASLIYFILYLCTLEIIPVVIFVLGAASLSRFFH